MYSSMQRININKKACNLSAGFFINVQVQHTAECRQATTASPKLTTAPRRETTSSTANGQARPQVTSTFAEVAAQALEGLEQHVRTRHIAGTHHMQPCRDFGQFIMIKIGYSAHPAYVSSY